MVGLAEKNRHMDNIQYLIARENMQVDNTSLAEKVGDVDWQRK